LAVERFLNTAMISVIVSETMNRCPVCGFTGLRRPPRSFTICPNCGTEFEYHDFGTTQEEVNRRRAELRNRWIDKGPRWHSRVIPQPANWNPVVQLMEAGFSFQLGVGEMVVRPIRGISGLHIFVHGATPARMTERRADAVLVDA
jgi:ribosomal protein L37AE/L43A